MFLTWTIGVTMATVGTILVWILLFITIHFVSLEYLFVVRNIPYESLYLSRWSVIPCASFIGLRYGLVVGTFLGLFSYVRSFIPKSIAILFISTASVSIFCALGAFALSKLELLKLPEIIHLQVGHPYRVLFSFGLEYGAIAGLVIGAAIAGTMYRLRKKFKSYSLMVNGSSE